MVRGEDIGRRRRKEGNLKGRIPLLYVLRSEPDSFPAMELALPILFRFFNTKLPLACSPPRALSLAFSFSFSNRKLENIVR